MKEMLVKMFICLSLLFGMFACHSNGSLDANNSKLIKDMAGREVLVPKNIERIFCADMTTSILMYSLDPKLLIGVNNQLDKESSRYLPESFRELPALGRVFLGKSKLNEEELIGLRPDVLICPVFRFTGKTDLEGFEKIAQRIGVPAILVDMEIEKLPDTYRFLGKLLNKQQKAVMLEKYCKRTLQLAAKAKALNQNPITFYVAEGENGLRTIPAGSTHSQIFDMVGFKNCAVVNERYGYSDMQINIEQLISWDPEIIFLSGRQKRGSIASFLKKASWQELNAVKNRKVVPVPTKPFSYIGRPPSINRLIGIYWLVSQIDDNLLEQGLEHEVVDFYQKFYHVRLNRMDLNEMDLNESSHEKSI